MRFLEEDMFNKINVYYMLKLRDTDDESIIRLAEITGESLDSLVAMRRRLSESALLPQIVKSLPAREISNLV